MWRYFIVFNFFLLLMGAELEAQDEILLVGVSHAYSDRNPQRFQAVFQEVFAFQPQQIATEFISPNDKNLALHLGGKKLRKRAEEISQKSGCSEKKRAEKIEEYLDKPNRSLHEQIKLCGLLYAQYDLANFYFQFYQLFKRLSTEKANQQMQWLTATEKYLFTKEENLTIANQLLGSEFGNLIFPLANALGVAYLHGVDNQDYYKEYQKAEAKSNKKLQRKLNLKGRELRHYFWGKYDSLDYAATKENREFAFLNSAEHDALVRAAFQKIGEADKTKTGKTIKALWDYRNQKIAENIIQFSLRYPQQRMVIFLGANHIPFVTAQLEQLDMNVLRLDLKR